MTQTIARLQAADKYVHDTDLRLLYHPFVKHYYDLCYNEIELMRCAEIETGLTCFDIFTANKYKLANYVTNEKVIEAFKCGQIFQFFLFYMQTIWKLVSREVMS